MVYWGWSIGIMKVKGISDASGMVKLQTLKTLRKIGFYVKWPEKQTYTPF